MHCCSVLTQLQIRGGINTIFFLFLHEKRCLIWSYGYLSCISFLWGFMKKMQHNLRLPTLPPPLLSPFVVFMLFKIGSLIPKDRKYKVTNYTMKYGEMFYLDINSSSIHQADQMIHMKCHMILKGMTLKSNEHTHNKSCRRTASSPAGYILYCNIFIIKPYNIGHTDLDVFVCKSFCHLDIIIQVWQFSMK